jgi:hypothetical protein
MILFELLLIVERVVVASERLQIPLPVLLAVLLLLLRLGLAMFHSTSPNVRIGSWVVTSIQDISNRRSVLADGDKHRF